ncbi:MAG: hypothetical protein JWN24_2965 [Phycisphaerales bacterium]|nr:hypothetical protein [Phycisphaerales bacterium]
MGERPQTIDYAPPEPHKRWRQHWWTIIPIILITLFLTYLAFMAMLTLTIM